MTRNAWGVWTAAVKDATGPEGARPCSCRCRKALTGSVARAGYVTGPAADAEDPRQGLGAQKFQKSNISLRKLSRFFFLRGRMIVSVTMVIAARGRACLRGRRVEEFERHAALNDLVQLSTVQPDAATLRAIVDFDAVAIRHYELGAVNRALHDLS